MNIFSTLIRTSAVTVVLMSAPKYSYADYWQVFIDVPDHGNFSELSEYLSTKVADCDWGSAANADVLSVEFAQSLFSLVAEGNDLAFQIGITVLPCLDGGELGDFFRSSGRYFDVHPRKFVKALAQAKVETNQIIRMLTMAPADSYNDFDQRLLRISQRIILWDENSDVFPDKVSCVVSVALHQEKQAIEREFQKAHDRNAPIE
jgi:hypothetical protein